MNRYKQAPTLVKIRTVLVIILSALVASVIIELILAERTNALLKETVQGTTSLVQQVLSPVAPTTPAPAQNVAPAKSPTSAPQASSSSSPAAPAPDSSVASSPVVTTPVSSVAPIEYANLQKLYFSKAKMSESSATVRFAGVRDNAASSTTFAWVQATEQGWKVAGVLWYWWLTGVATIAAGFLLWRQRIKQFAVSRLLYTQHKLYAE